MVARSVRELLEIQIDIDGRTIQNSSDATKLRQSVLAAAFSGKLVPQDQADEPANVLLDRLRASRAAGRNPRPRGRRSLGISGVAGG